MDEMKRQQIRDLARTNFEAELESGVELDEFETDPADVVINVWDDDHDDDFARELGIDPTDGDAVYAALQVYAEAFVQLVREARSR